MLLSLILVAVAGSAVLADNGVTFPEVARGFSNARIVSGWPAEPGQIPHQLSLRMVNPLGQVSSCGGSIIHHEWGLTAAHCTAQRVTLVIRMNSANLTQPGLIFETTEYYNHPQYNEAIASIVQPNDIGLIKFNRYVEYGFGVQPIRIQRHVDRDVNYDQIRTTASGYGLTWTGGSSSEILNWVFLRAVSNAFCAASFNFSPIIQTSTICASGYNVTSQSTCQGDSGGPLSVVERDGKETIVGVTSFVSSQGCHANIPAGFVRAGYYHSWYTQVTGIDFDWDFEESSGEGPEDLGVEETADFSNEDYLEEQPESIRIIDHVPYFETNKEKLNLW